jgi:hypothetical protein
VMLYLLYRGNHPDVHYQGGQRPIVHLQADLRRTIDWAEEEGIRWAFPTVTLAHSTPNFLIA